MADRFTIAKTKERKSNMFQISMFNRSVCFIRVTLWLLESSWTRSYGRLCTKDQKWTKSKTILHKKKPHSYFPSRSIFLYTQNLLRTSTFPRVTQPLPHWTWSLFHSLVKWFTSIPAGYGARRFHRVSRGHARSPAVRWAIIPPLSLFLSRH